MNFEDAIGHVRSFWPAGQAFPLGAGDPTVLKRLESEHARGLPEVLRAYVSKYAPAATGSFDTIGNPMMLYGVAELSAKVDGFSWNPVTGKPIHEWSSAWFLIGDEGGDPMIVDLDVAGDACGVRTAFHGEGVWDFFEAATSLPAFLVLSAAQHHAFNAFVPWGEATVENAAGGLDLCDAAASWFFPFVRRVAPDDYDRWAGQFDNA